MWNFRQIRARAIRELSNQLGPVKKIKLARRFIISQWFLPGFTELIQRRRAPSPKDCQSLGLYATAGIFRIREKVFFSSRHTTENPEENPFHNPSFDYQEAIMEELKGELDEYGA